MTLINSSRNSRGATLKSANRRRAIKIWVSKNSEVSVREQIITQISLGVVSGDLEAGEKLPSTRELARRFELHPNTVPAAYRELARQNLVEFKKGSGVYIREDAGDSSKHAVRLDRIINRCFHEAAAAGFTPEEIKNNLRRRLAAKPPTHFLVVESDAELRKILIEEISAATDRPVRGIAFEDLPTERPNDDQEVWLMFDKSANSPKMPPDANFAYLKANSVPDSMTGKERPTESDLIAIVSGWGKFLTLARMFLLAARIAPETLIVRLTDEPNWKTGLQSVSLIICDSATAKELPEDERVRVFRLIADSSLEELRDVTG